MIHEENQRVQKCSMLFRNKKYGNEYDWKI